MLEGFAGERLRERQQSYAEFVEQGLTAAMWDPAEAAVAQTVIGSDGFVDRMRRAVATVSEKAGVRRECGRQRGLLSWVRLKDVLLATAEEYGVEPRSLVVRWSRGNEARQVLLYLAAERCRGRYPATELARRLGRISISGLAKAHRRLAERLRVDARLRATVRRIEAAMGAKSNA